MGAEHVDCFAAPQHIEISMLEEAAARLASARPPNHWSAKRTVRGSFSPVGLFRFCRSRHLECAVCSRDIVRLSESKCDRAETGFAPVPLPQCDKAVRRFGGDRAALICRYRLSRHAPEHVPHSLFRQPLSPGFPRLVHTTKQPARCNVRCLKPLIEDILYPGWHRDGANVACLSLQIDNGPVVFTLLNVAEA